MYAAVGRCCGDIDVYQRVEQTEYDDEDDGLGIECSGMYQVLT